MKHILKYKLFEYTQRGPETFPAEEFGQHTGMDWVYTLWKMPQGLDEERLSKLLISLYDKINDNDNGTPEFEEGSTKMMDLYKEMSKLNPPLGTIKVKSFGDLFDIMFGAASKFNFDDIKYFTETVSEDHNAIIKYNIKEKARRKVIEKAAGHDMQWVPSPKTTDRLEKELGIK